MPSLLRRALRRVRARPLWLVYDDAYERTLPGVPLDPRRADRILAFLSDAGTTRRGAVQRPDPVSIEAILRVHARAYVESLDRPDVVSAILGVEVRDPERQAALDLQRLQTGGTVLAARLAHRTGRIAANLGGGFHHAEPNRGMGFCLLNDVAIAIRHLRHYGFAGRVLVVDLDLHDGNGTRAVFRDDPSVYTFSIHNADWGPTDGVATTALALGAGVDDHTYLNALRETLPVVVDRHRPEFVVYVAGADPAQDDRIGDWNISEPGLLARDRFVFDTIQRGVGAVPCVIVLGGGYGGRAWRYAARCLAWLAIGEELEPPDELDQILRRFRRLKTVLAAPARDGPEEKGWGLTADDLAAVAPGTTRAPRLLDRFSAFAVELSLERAGILGALRVEGFRHPIVILDRHSPLGETLRVFGDHERRELLIELRLTRSRQAVKGMDVLYAEWLLVQNPHAKFSDANPRLPGQSYPGLGLLKEVVAWLVVICETLGLDGLAFTPGAYYMAVLGRHHMRFLDPDAQGRFLALRSALGGLTLVEAERALAEGHVRDAAGRPVRWIPTMQVYPVSERLRARVDSPAYDAAVQSACDTARFRLAMSEAKRET